MYFRLYYSRQKTEARNQGNPDFFHKIKGGINLCYFSKVQFLIYFILKKKNCQGGAISMIVFVEKW